MQLELAEAREMAASLHVDNSRLQQQTEALAAEAQVLRGERAEMERSNAYHMKRAMLLEKHLRQLLSSTDPTDTLAHLGRLAFEHSHGTPNFGSPLKR
jgi:FtsZ-binding cell division protein ZapB